MPIHFPHFGHKDRTPPDTDKYLPTSPRRGSIQLAGGVDSNGTPSPNGGNGSSVEFAPPTRSSTSTSSQALSPNSGSVPPPGILRKVETSSSASEYTNSSTGGGSAFLQKRLSGLNFDRTDTISSVFSEDENSTRDGGSSTPATSVSSFGGQCPLPSESGGNKFPFTMVTLSGVSTLSFIALPTHMRPAMLVAIQKAWRKGISKSGQVDYMPELMKKHQEKGCDGGVWEITMKDNCWMPDSKDKVSSKRIIINVMTEFAREGYNLTSSFRTSAKDSGKDTLIFLRGEPDPDPIFFAVAFHSSDRVWIIDAEADVGEALENGIRTWWLDGIRDARVRERHCREIRLKGSPWTAHHHSQLISARCIHLAIMKYITHCDRGYDYVGSVQMADIEEGEMAVSFYRRKWGPERAVWDLQK